MMSSPYDLASYTGLSNNPETPPHFQEAVDEPPSTVEVEPEVEVANEQEEEDSPIITLRSIVSTKEAGVVIGKGGKNVAEIREATGVKAGVSKVIQGVHERILTVTGGLEQVARAYAMISKFLIENPTATQSQSMPDCTTIRLLVAHQLMGSVIGKAGAKIREIQDGSSAKIIISKEMLPQSTERTIDVFGDAESIQIAIQKVGDCIFSELDRAVGCIQYNPQVRLGFNGVPHRSYRDDSRQSTGKPRNANDRAAPGEHYKRYPRQEDQGDLETRDVPIPSGMVGCIIGHRGVFVNEIRRSSGARVSISKLPDPATDHRTFTVTGTPEANEVALSMLYQQLDLEKDRRESCEGVDE